MTTSHLPSEELRKLIAAAIQLGLHDRRDVLLNSIDPDFRSRLPIANSRSPGDQLQLDLQTLNEVTLTDGTVPLVEWLQNGINAAARRSGSEVLDHALNRLAPNTPKSYGSTWTPPIDLPAGREKVIHPDGRVPFDFLQRGRNAGASVALVSVRRFDHGQPSYKPPSIGTGWLIGPGLLLTAFHVVQARDDHEAAATSGDLELQAGAATATFGRDSDEQAGRVIRCSRLEVSDSQLDFAILRLDGDPGAPPLQLAERLPVVDAKQHPPLNIIQHPHGRPKMIAIRNNLATTAKDRPTDLGYFSDTDMGASGAPVFDDNWRVVAVHRAWAPLPEVENFQGSTTAIANLGTRIDTIRAHLRGQCPDLWQEIARSSALLETEAAARLGSRQGEGGTVVSLPTQRHSSFKGGTVTGGPAPDQLLDRIRALAALADQAEVGRPDLAWDQLDLQSQLEQIAAQLDSIKQWLHRGGLDDGLGTFELRFALQQFPGIAERFVEALGSLQVAPKPGASRETPQLDDYRAAWRLLQASLWEVHGELLAVISGGSGQG